jgi:hypothetical protein
MQTVVLARLNFVAHVDFAGWIFADENNGQAGLLATGGQGGGACSDIRAKGLGEGVAVDDLSSHGDLGGEAAGCLKGAERGRLSR